MRGVLALVNPVDDDDVWFDLSDYVDSTRPLEFPPPPKTVVTAENFSAPGAKVGGVHHGLRSIRVPLVLYADSTDQVRTLWREMCAALEAGAALEFAPDGGDTLFFDLTPSDASPDYDSGDWGSEVLLATLDLRAQPFARGPEITAAFDESMSNSPNNTIVIPEVLGDVEAPANVHVDVGSATPNRASLRFFRRTKGNPANFVSLLEFDETYSLGDHTTEGATDLIYDGNVDTMERVATWRIDADQVDNTGRFHVYVMVKDWEEASGNLKMQMELRFEDLSEGYREPVQRIKADVAHLGGAAYELWYLGTFDVPDYPAAPSVWYWRLYAQRLGDVDNVHIRRVFLMPVDESPLALEWDADRDVTDDPAADFSFTTDPKAAWWGTLDAFKVPATPEGRGLWLKPGRPNHVLVVASIDGNSALDHDPPSISDDEIASVTIKYRPRYRWVSSPIESA